jgi:hypothetical protein
VKENEFVHTFIVLRIDLRSKFCNVINYHTAI